MDETDLGFNQRREAEERLLATRSASAALAAVRLDMANRYALRVAKLIEASGAATAIKRPPAAQLAGTAKP